MAKQNVTQIIKGKKYQVVMDEDHIRKQNLKASSVVTLLKESSTSYVRVTIRKGQDIDLRC